MMVVLEWFTSAHSIYRTHSLTLEAARDKFHLVAMAYENCTDDQTRKVFHEVVAIPREASMLDQIKLIQNEAKTRKVDVFYMPSVGMFPLTMWLANLRMAPLQVMGLGHPATSHSDVIDYVVVEEDYVGDPACFSEKLLLLPADGMPYRPSASATGINVMRPPRASADVVQVAMCATTMKLNPEFLQACAEIIRRSSVPLHFHFLIGQAQGLTFPHVHKVISQYLGEHVTVYPHQPYVPYMQVIGACDMFINPFPFGNTNGIIDTISAGLVGVCKSGNEVHEHIDEGLFRRLGMPDWLIARSTEEYILATLRLAANHTERAWLRNRLSSPEKVKVLFKGRPEIMSERLLECLTHS
jgi:predicted O-linked N-acetylglucosamine transferase (SPINDLY family)